MSSIAQQGQRSRVSIMDFPTELFLIIFKKIHDEFIAHSMGSDGLQEKEKDRNADLTTFPYSFASVSKAWKEMMAIEPIFWTNIVIYIDSNDFSLASISSHLSYSRQLPIDVRVTKMLDILPESEAHENRRLQAIADIVKPHVHRCLTLRYEVTYTSSLPRISAHLQGTFPLLTELCLEASKLSETIQTPADVTWDIQCPSLVCLALDGLNFMDVFFNARDLLDQVQWKREPSSKIAISYLRQSPNHATNKLSFEDVWPLISRAYTLHLEDLDLECDAHHMPQFEQFDGSRTLVNLNCSITNAVLLHYSSMGSLKIDGCCLDDLRRVFPIAGYLSLVNINDVERLSLYLPEWIGDHLDIHNCPGFDDTVLMALGEGNFFWALSELCIVNCSNFSPAVLRHVMKGFDLRHFSLKGQNVPAMMDQDKEWFSAKGCTLSWNE